MHELTADPWRHARAADASGTPVVGVSSSAVPREIIEAAGGLPFVVRRSPGNEPHADALLEPGVFAPRMSGIFEGLLAGEWPCLRALVLPRTSEQEYKMFLYLREVAREGTHGRFAPPLLFDLLQTASSEARAYVVDRLHELAGALGAMTGHEVTGASLATAILDANRARRATQALLALRKGQPRVMGVEARSLVGASQFTTARHYAEHAEAAVLAFAHRAPIQRPRVAIVGAPLDVPDLHEAVERSGGVVTWEEDAGGVMQPGPLVGEAADPYEALADSYRALVTARTFAPADRDRPLVDALEAGVDGVVFFIPPDDSVAGWDVPRRRRLLESRGVPSVQVRDATHALTDETRAALETFVARLPERG